MSNQTDPLQVTNSYYAAHSLGPWNKKTEIKLSVNEFSDQRNLFGFLAGEPEINNFLSKDTVRQYEEQMDPTFKYGFSVYFTLSDKRTNYEREAYTFFQLIGDVGGFNSAIIFLPAFLMSYYNSHMYQLETAQEIPIRKPAKSLGKLQSSYLRQKIFNYGSQGQGLEAADIKILRDSVARNFVKRPDQLRSFMPCMKSKKMRLQEKVSSRFEDMLDIRCLVSLHTNLALLLPLLLTDQQALLFKHQVARALHTRSR